MILTPVSSTVAHSTSAALTFVGLGGYGTLTYSISVNNSGGSINGSTGVYNSGASHPVTEHDFSDRFIREHWDRIGKRDLVNTTQLCAYYSNTLPAEYRTQPNAYATIGLLAYVALMPQDGGVVTDPSDGSVVTNIDGSPVMVLDPNASPILPLAIIPAFDITTAVGEQLNFIAEGIGASRFGLLISGQAVTLDDTHYRLLLQAVQARNFLVATTACPFRLFRDPVLF